MTITLRSRQELQHKSTQDKLHQDAKRGPQGNNSCASGRAAQDLKMVIQASSPRHLLPPQEAVGGICHHALMTEFRWATMLLDPDTDIISHGPPPV
jgi:hypothetical protein